MYKNNIPEFLYHYTTIETLEKILSNKTIRFNSLENVDDKEEKKTKDMGDFGKYCFISCWTDKANENEDLWNRYGHDGKGVRLKLHSYPFRKHYLFIGNLNGVLSYFKGSELNSRGYMIAFDKNLANNMLTKVEYTKDKEKIYPKLKQFENKNNIVINYNDIGKYKSNKWDVQNEWRYKFMILPIDKDTVDLSNPRAIYNSLKKGEPLPFTDYYLEIEKEYLNNIELLLGPKTTEEDFKSVVDIINKNNIKAVINKSDLNY